MSSAIERLDALELESSKGQKVQAYYGRLKISKKYFLLKRNQVCLADIDDKKCLTLQIVSSNNLNTYLL